jgi:hypothetical protein
VLEHFIDRHFLSLRERVRGIAPRASEIAPGQAYEHARLAGVSRLPLYRIENLVHAEHNKSILASRMARKR